MGVLDDAIREHLDLKRARGADPAEIERMEREALGPVRREPTLGSTRFGPIDEEAPDDFEEPEFHEDHLTELEDLQELGYHDSTAPHPHPHHQHLRPHHEPAEADLDFEHDGADHLEPPAEEIEPPKRRFLRRNRPASLSAPAPLPDPGFHEAPPSEHSLDPPGPLDHRDPLDHHDPLEHPDPLGHAEPEPPRPASPPPHLQFEHPPKRPRFTAQPPSLEPETNEHPQAPTQPQDAAPGPPSPAPASPSPASPTAAAPAPQASPRGPAPAAPAPSAPEHPAAPEYEHFDEPEAEPLGAQETTEFDVQKHLAEAPPEEDEDVLEETPDFLQDTPEHDRLWFEQRPPKDFDFNG